MKHERQQNSLGILIFKLISRSVLFLRFINQNIQNLKLKLKIMPIIVIIFSSLNLTLASQTEPGCRQGDN